VLTHLTCFEFVLRLWGEKVMAKLDVEQVTKEMTRVAEAVLGDGAQMKTVRELIPENALLFPGANDKEAWCRFIFKRRPWLDWQWAESGGYEGRSSALIEELNLGKNGEFRLQGSSVHLV
jgi:hypothetical protein